MAVADNAGAKIGSAGQNFENIVASANAPDKSKPRTDSVTDAKEANFQQLKPAAATINDGDSNIKMQNGFNKKNQQQMLTKTAGCNEFSNMENGGDGEIFNNHMNNLVEILSKLNPLAEEFVPPSLANRHHNLNDNQHQNKRYLENGFGYSTDSFVVYTNSGNTNGHTNRRKRNNFSQGKRRLNGRTNMAQQEDVIRKTVYVSDIDLQVTEELLAGLFLSCGPVLLFASFFYLVVDCRICGDPNSVLRFAFVEFYNEEDARAALNLSGTILGYYPSEDEREMCARTIYCTNIDKKVTQADVKLFFESVCGEVQCMRILGDYHHSSRIAFVEFTMVFTHLLCLFNETVARSISVVSDEENQIVEMTGSVTVVPFLSLLPSLFTESLGLMDWEDIVFLRGYDHS
ncbi:Polyadenylate-binding, cytoplasmic and nuclear [Gossypium australe]|uniref:Polyadenylate-binding, cytoplasmic and nuclear n=1 Tax=Gossypium australe TaxID=47621 RepID=A0A5B6VM79_9ROSI|nr:Polyadenylate-binding, cytoplasmic and nuclear [Gossypium australe]